MAAPRLVLIRTTPLTVPAVAGRPSTVYRRRRAAALLVVVGALAGVLLTVQAVLASFSASAAGPASPPADGSAAIYVVQPGDTFWEIARRLRPHDDPRPLVSRMVAEHGSAALVAGERLRMPVPA